MGRSQQLNRVSWQGNRSHQFTFLISWYKHQTRTSRTHNARTSLQQSQQAVLYLEVSEDVRTAIFPSRRPPRRGGKCTSRQLTQTSTAWAIVLIGYRSALHVSPGFWTSRGQNNGMSVIYEGGPRNVSPGFWTSRRKNTRMSVIYEGGPRRQKWSSIRV